MYYNTIPCVLHDDHNSMSVKKNKLNYSIVIPVYRSQNTLQKLHLRLKKTLGQQKYKYEIIYVDDGSDDNSCFILEEIFKKEKNVKVIRLAHNFGQHNALMCGFSYAKGDFIITLDDDLQNPPEEIPKLIDKQIKGNYDLVYGKYDLKRHGNLRNLGSALIQFIYQRIFRVKGRLTSFRLIRQNIVKEILKYQKHFTFIDGLLAWHTKNIGYVKVAHQERLTGRSGYSFSKLLFLSLNLLTNFSVFPLQFASITGFLFSFIGLVIGLYMLAKKLVYGIPITGFASVFVSVAILAGIQLVTIGIIGEYIGRIYLNINLKPQYIIQKVLSREKNDQ